MHLTERAHQLRQRAHRAASQLETRLARRVLRRLNRRNFEQDFLPALPPALRPAARGVFLQDWTAEERRLGRKVETFRPRIAEYGATLTSMSSPLPGTFQLDDRGHSRGAELTAATVGAHMQTGVRPSGGLLLRRLLSGAQAKSVLELGTNTGFSGCYMLAAESQPALLTVEGSPELCDIARANLARFSTQFEVRNGLFDEVLSELLALGRRFDCIFIDGQHEERATLHYAQRARLLLERGGLLVLDDIYWSHGMHAAWRTLCATPGYETTFDLGWKGVAVVGAEQQRPLHFDLCEYIGRPRIANTDR